MHDTRVPLSLSVKQIARAHSRYCVTMAFVMRNIMAASGSQPAHTVLWSLNVRASRSVRDPFKG
jgi:hypothetical protein